MDDFSIASVSLVVILYGIIEKKRDTNDSDQKKQN